MIHGRQVSNNAMLNFIWFPSFKMHMQYLLYYVVCFKVWNTTNEVFMVDDVDVAMANCGVFTQWHAHDAKVTSTWYTRVNGIPSPSSGDID
jgi:hypothetical protein